MIFLCWCNVLRWIWCLWWKISLQAWKICLTTVGIEPTTFGILAHIRLLTACTKDHQASSYNITFNSIFNTEAVSIIIVICILQLFPVQLSTTQAKISQLVNKMCSQQSFIKLLGATSICIHVATNNVESMLFLHPPTPDNVDRYSVVFWLSYLWYKICTVCDSYFGH
jgi:hypothetical protein